MRLAWLVLLAAVMPGCGGSGGASAGSALQPEQLTVSFATHANDPATVLYAVDLVLQLPDGVTVAADASGAAAGVLVPADGGALAGARYYPRAGGVPATAKVIIADPTGFAVGPLGTLTCNVAPGYAANASAFGILAFSAKDHSGAPLPEITADFTLRSR
jgi:hypothetical protein